MPKRFRGGILQARLPEISAIANTVASGIYNTADVSQYVGSGNWVSNQFYQQYGTPGTYSFVVPNGVNTISVLAVGAGGAGDDGNAGDGGGGGGAGGACAVASNVAVIPGNTITVVVGAGGASGQGKGVKAENGGNTTVTVGNAIPSNGYSVLFDGSGDYLSVLNNSNLDLSSGDFTVECWFYISSTPSVSRPILGRMASNVLDRTYLQYLISYTSAGSVVITPYSSTSNYDMVFASVSLNSWHHVALVRSGNSFYAYLDGNRNATTRTISGSLNTGSWLTYLGVYTEGGTSYFNNGYISNVRIIKGTALYTGSTYTVPTAPLTNIANTSLLTCQSNRFIDNSTNNFTINVLGDSSVSSASPFTSSSVLFDGTGDYLTIADNAALQMGSGNFTIEYWWYPNSIAGYQTPYDKGYTGAGGLLLQTGNGDGRTIVYASGSAVVTSNTALIANSWTHMALVRNGTNLTLYQNGISVGSVTNSTNFNNANTAGLGGNATGASFAGQYPINGYISNLRSVKGTAVYTSAFTPPAAPLTAIANTSLLTCQSNRFIDNSTNNFTITVNGNSSVSSVSPFAFIIDAAGGRGGAPYTANPGATGANAVFTSIPSGVVTAGYVGGNGGPAFNGGGGGGGAAGAAGNGGTGSAAKDATTTNAPTNSYAGGGGGAVSAGGTGSLGGANGGTGQNDTTGGGGGGAYTFTSVAEFLDTNGSNGNGLTTSGSKGGNGGFPGGGGGGSFDGGVGVASSGGNGFVRIVWGTNSSGVRKFPDNALDTQEIR